MLSYNRDQPSLASTCACVYENIDDLAVADECHFTLDYTLIIITN